MRIYDGRVGNRKMERGFRRRKCQVKSWGEWRGAVRIKIAGKE